MSTLSTSGLRAREPRTPDGLAGRSWTAPGTPRLALVGDPSAPATSLSVSDAPALTPPSALIGILRARLDVSAGESTRTRYFGSLDDARIEDGALVVPVVSSFVAGLAERRFGTMLREAARELFGVVHVRLDVCRSPAAEPSDSAEVALLDRRQAPGAIDRGPDPREATGAARRDASEASAPRPRDAGRARHTFETFIEGTSNALALHAARALASGDVRLSPLFIHGPCGTGKTHLLHAIAHAFRGSEMRVRCLTGEAFTNEFISAMRAQRLDDFRRDFRRVDLLCLDDVHFIADKKATQAELLHTFDAVDLKGKLVVLASDEHPDRIARLGGALASRFVSGAVAALGAPDAHLCRCLLAGFAARRETLLEPGAETLMLERFEALRAEGRLSVRDVEAAVTQVVAMSRLTGARGPIAASLAARALGLDAPSPSARARRPLPPDRIIHATCEALGVDRAEFSGRCRSPRVVLARGLSALLAREMTNLSFPEIARAMGRPNHSTVITAMNRMKSQLDGSTAVAGLEGGAPALRALAERLRRELVKAAGGPIGA